MPRSPLSLLDHVVLYVLRWFLISRDLIRGFWNSTSQPTYVKSYAYRPSLQHRVFLPAGLTLKEAKTYPLIFEIHGGGFVVGHPGMDDEYCKFLSTRCSAVVVSLDYRLAPGVQYPAPQNDCRDAIEAVLSDPELPIDHDNVVISGMSAGGNLALSMSQSEPFRGKFRAVVAWYPVTDFAASLEERLNYRPKTETPEDQVRMWHVSSSAYLPAAADLKDPGLSPFHASMDAFPKRMFFIGAEIDTLLYDSERMAEKLAGEQIRVDREENGGLLSCWTTGQVEWTLVRNQPHGFNQLTVKGDAEIKRQEITKVVNGKLVRWLCDEVFSGVQNK